MKFPRSMSQKIFWDFRFFPDLSGKIRIFYFLSQFLINFLFLFFVKNLFNFYIFFFYFWVFLLNLGSKMKIVQILKIPKVNESETPFSIYWSSLARVVVPGIDKWVGWRSCLKYYLYSVNLSARRQPFNFLLNITSNAIDAQG